MTLISRNNYKLPLVTVKYVCDISQLLL